MVSTIPIPVDAERPRRDAPAAAILVLSNLVPLAGILWWGWDVFVLLCLYWLETVAIGFWTIVRVAALSQPPEGANVRGGALGLAGFFTVHAGIFMIVHMVFLFVLFAGAWAGRIHGPRDFVRLIVVDSGLWIPLLALFAAEGALFVNDAVNRFVFARPQADAGADPGRIVSGFYTRIVLMHVAIIGGAFIVEAIGNSAPLILLVLLKVALEIVLLWWRRQPWRHAAA